MAARLLPAAKGFGHMLHVVNDFDLVIDVHAYGSTTETAQQIGELLTIAANGFDRIGPMREKDHGLTHAEGPFT